MLRRWLAPEPAVETQSEAFPAAERETMLDAVLKSPYLADNPLNYRFSGTLGFSVVFRSESWQRVLKTFPAWQPYLLRIQRSDINAYYLNPLIVKAGAHVGKHMDLSLRSYTRPIDPPPPRRVSVLYLDVPPSMQGGDLCLYNGDRFLQRIRPVTNLLVHFRGNLSHEVAEAHYEEGLRVSLVCEQYRLPAWFLKKIPRYTIQSSSPFSTFLDEELSQVGLTLEDLKPE